MMPIDQLSKRLAGVEGKEVLFVKTMEERP